MERRKFVKSVTLAGIPVTVISSANAQSFGTPASLSNGALAVPSDGLLTLPIDDSAIPPQIKGVTRAMMELFSRISEEPSFANAFFRNPTKILFEYRLNDLIDSNDPMIDALRLAADPSMKEFMRTADYKSFMSQLKSQGFLYRPSKSKLKGFYIDVLTKDQNSFDRYVKNLIKKAPNELLDSVGKNQRINKIIDILQLGGRAVPLDNSLQVSPENSESAVIPVTVLAYIAAAVYVYVVAAANAGVAINAAVVITAVLWVAVSVFGFDPEASLTSATNLETSKKPLGQNLRDMQRIQLATNIYGRKDLMLEALTNGMAKEMEAMIAAAEQVGILRLQSGTRKLLLKELKLLSLETLGLGA